MERRSQTFEAITERDVDLLLLEELMVQSEFRTWVIETLGITQDVENFEGAWHSVFDSELGESDLEFGFVSGGTRHLVLMENKINAPLQDNQLQRYHERGSKATRDNWDEYTTVLVAPEKYISKTSETQTVGTTLPYEDIKGWFMEQETPRSNFKAEMLTEAIEQRRRGYVSEPDEDMTALHQYYYSLAEEHPELGMETPGGVPGGNSWIRFKPSSLPSDVKLIHKLRAGNVDLQFTGDDKSGAELRNEYGGLLTDGMGFVEMKKSMAIRAEVEPITLEHEPHEQRERILNGLNTASSLLSVFHGSE